MNQFISVNLKNDEKNGKISNELIQFWKMGQYEDY